MCREYKAAIEATRLLHKVCLPSSMGKIPTHLFSRTDTATQLYQDTTYSAYITYLQNNGDTSWYSLVRSI